MYFYIILKKLNKNPGELDREYCTDSKYRVDCKSGLVEQTHQDRDQYVCQGTELGMWEDLQKMPYVAILKIVSMPEILLKDIFRESTKTC